ncbi:MAG TPA: hypothetical protein DDX98_10810 [Bacteroidales bacterium]|jgi:hypothetical protein|nr:hypothetical protein [Bacteroidales bacterium]
MTIKKILLPLFAACVILSFSACDQEGGDGSTSIFPSKFKVDIPSSLSNSIVQTAGLKSSVEDTLLGNEIYEHLNFFIAVGENSAELVEAIMYAIQLYNIENLNDLLYNSDDDGRVKHLTVTENAQYMNTSYEYMLIVTDYESESDNDGGYAMQVYWNNSPVQGIALLKPYNINRMDDNDLGEAMFKIEYSSAATEDYDELMIVSISKLPLPSAEIEPWALESMKMYVGKRGNVVDVFGNSNHPNAQFDPYASNAVGYNWAFVASGKTLENIGVAEVGLPFSDETADSRSVLIDDNSIYHVFEREISNYLEQEYGLSSNEYAKYLEGFLNNAKAPGFFDKYGFVQSESSPGAAYDELETRIAALRPFVPAQVSNLTIEFIR